VQIQGHIPAMAAGAAARTGMPFPSRSLGLVASATSVHHERGICPGEAARALRAQ